MRHQEGTLAERLGVTQHVSILRRKVERLARQFPSASAACVEDWLVDVANARGARVVTREPGPGPDFRAPGRDEFCDEELIVAICQVQCLDRPQMLRLAAQMISRGVVDFERLRRLAIQERTERILAELARLALRVDPEHALWKRIEQAFRGVPHLREPLLHWTRLAVPVMEKGRPNAVAWKLVT